MTTTQRTSSDGDIRHISIELFARAIAVVLLVILVWCYSDIWSLGAVRGFLLGIAWGVALSSFEKNALLSALYCLAVGVSGAFFEPTFDAIMIMALGFSAALFTHSRMFSALQNANLCWNILRHIVLRLGRSVIALLGGLAFLLLPFPGNPVDPAGGGDITGRFQSFLLFIAFMAVPVLISDFLVGRLVKKRYLPKCYSVSGASY